MGLASECNFSVVSTGRENAESYVPHEQDRETCLIFIASETKVCLQTLQTRRGVVVPAVD
jgi:hypothetical protein